MEDYLQRNFDEKSWTVVSARKKRSLSNHNITDLPVKQGTPQEPDPSPTESAIKNEQMYNSFYSNTNEKISEPCWFFNNGGCRHKDGSEKNANECKYLHIYSENVKRPPHLSTKKPCDKFNLEGECNWGDNCKYSHRTLTTDEWEKYYPEVPFTLKTSFIHQKQVLETTISDIEEHIKVMEFKQDGMSTDIQYIGQGLQKCLRTLQILMEKMNMKI